MIVFIYKWFKNAVFRRVAGRLQATLRKCPAQQHARRRACSLHAPHGRTASLYHRHQHQHRHQHHRPSRATVRKRPPPPFAPFNSKNGREHRGKAALKKEMWFSQTSLSPARTIRAGHSARAILPAVNATGRALPSARPVRRASAQASTCMAGTCLVRTSR
jgi:hypothetical protein